MPERDELRCLLAQVEARLAAAEGQLFESDAKYEALLEQLPAAIYVDEAYADGRTLFISPYVEKVLGITPEEYIAGAATWDQMVHPEDRERLKAEYEAFLEDGEFASGDYRYIRPDGRTVWIHDRSHMVLGIDGEPLFVQGVMFDVTESEGPVAVIGCPPADPVEKGSGDYEGAAHGSRRGARRYHQTDIPVAIGGGYGRCCGWPARHPRGVHASCRHRSEPQRCGLGREHHGHAAGGLVL